MVVFIGRQNHVPENRSIRWQTLEATGRGSVFPGPCVLWGALSLKTCDGRDAVPRAVLGSPRAAEPALLASTSQGRHRA